MDNGVRGADAQRRRPTPERASATAVPSASEGRAAQPRAIPLSPPIHCTVPDNGFEPSNMSEGSLGTAQPGPTPEPPQRVGGPERKRGTRARGARAIPLSPPVFSSKEPRLTRILAGILMQMAGCEISSNLATSQPGSACLSPRLPGPTQSISIPSTCRWSNVERPDGFRQMGFDPSRPYDDLPDLPPAVDLESRAVRKACVRARAALAVLRQAAALIPNPTVLINTIPLLEAQAGCEIGNRHDERLAVSTRAAGFCGS